MPADGLPDAEILPVLHRSGLDRDPGVRYQAISIVREGITKTLCNSHLEAQPAVGRYNAILLLSEKHARKQYGNCKQYPAKHYFFAFLGPTLTSSILKTQP